MDIFTKAFVLTFSLILAIGAQNAYILKLGLLKRHVFKAVLFCTISDLFLIGLGIFGLGFFIKSNQIFINAIAIFGIIFLCFYAVSSFRSALKNQNLKIDDKNKISSSKQVLSMLFIFTYLNPHTYLDTVLLIGGIGASIDGSKILFLLGATFASFTWFFSLGYGARVLIPLFKRNMTWRILDVSIGVLMLYIAFGLLELIK
ncbi:MAG: amino acid transporter [Proteobacteria bacterium]|nr:MAG: amino acid transporter [Pseudomonadota bacterium]